MMLSFSNSYRQSKNLRFIFSINSNIKKINTKSDPEHVYAQNRLLQFKSYSTTSNKEEIILLEEINNVASTHKNFKVENLSLVLNEIVKHKTLGKGLPKCIKLTDVRDMLECETPTQRSKYLLYLFKKEQIKLKSKEKKLVKKIDNENKHAEILENVKNNHIQYGLGRNTLILKTFRRSFVKYYDKRLSYATLFGQKLVIDFGYDKFMSKKEKKACTSQIRLLYGYNRLLHDPYDLYICNASLESHCVEYLRNEMPNVDESFLTLSEQSYLDIFPKENLAYLSPHASEVLTTYDPKAVYIIGGFVDTVKRENVSFYKAQEEGIKSYRLPLDECVAWGSGSKSLAINQVFSILQTKRDTGDWKEAFKHLPTRKLKRLDINSDEIELYSDKLYAISH